MRNIQYRTYIHTYVAIILYMNWLLLMAQCCAHLEESQDESLVGWALELAHWLEAEAEPRTI